LVSKDQDSLAEFMRVKVEIIPPDLNLKNNISMAIFQQKYNRFCEENNLKETTVDEKILDGMGVV
jgi:hypothetical protein